MEFHEQDGPYVRISLIINAPSPDTVGQLRAEVEGLREAGHEVRPRLTFEQGDARRFALHAAEKEDDLIVVAGGDGTINEVVNGLHAFLEAAAAADTPRRTPPRLGIIPLGTGNDLAAALGIPRGLHAALDAALRGEPREVNIALVNDRAFLNVSTGGFGAEATEQASSDFKRALGTIAYVMEGVRKFASLEPSSARFQAEETIYEGAFLLFAVGNSQRTGGGNWVTPRADLADGLLDVCIVKELSRMEFLALMPTLRAGDHVNHPSVVYRQVRELVVESELTLSVNADGEPLRDRRFHYRISPHRLLLTRPPDRKAAS